MQANVDTKETDNHACSRSRTSVWPPLSSIPKTNLRILTPANNAKAASADTTAQLMELVGEECLITRERTPESVVTSHLLAYAAERKEIRPLEQCWGLQPGTLDHLSASNLIRLRTDIHLGFDADMWCLIPRSDTLRNICDYERKVGHKMPSEPYHRMFPSGIWEYHFVPLKWEEMGPPIPRQNWPSQRSQNSTMDLHSSSQTATNEHPAPSFNEVEHHRAPYTTYPILQSRAHPYFVIWNAGRKIKQRPPMEQSEDICDADGYVSYVSTLWRQRMAKAPIVRHLAATEAQQIWSADGNYSHDRREEGRSPGRRQFSGGSDSDGSSPCAGRQANPDCGGRKRKLGHPGLTTPDLVHESSSTCSSDSTEDALLASSDSAAGYSNSAEVVAWLKHLVFITRDEYTWSVDDEDPTLVEYRKERPCKPPKYIDRWHDFTVTWGMDWGVESPVMELDTSKFTSNDWAVRETMVYLPRAVRDDYVL